MPSGLKTAPATFQRMMEKLVGNISNVLIYLDVILIFASSIEELLQVMDTLLMKLTTSILKRRSKECSIEINASAVLPILSVTRVLKWTTQRSVQSKICDQKLLCAVFDDTSAFHNTIATLYISFACTANP
eukprot:NODE_183_length_15731_cov_0.226778.p9 type:complete len:131 gc:universal NODE_183_length_15731_cov_0.226778:11930-11538(-)